MTVKEYWRQKVVGFEYTGVIESAVEPLFEDYASVELSHPGPSCDSGSIRVSRRV